MTILSALRRKPAQPTDASTSDPTSETAASGSAPVDGYDGLSDREVNASLPKRTQVELAEIETYERANKGRVAVLDKLRYMRGAEPFEGYDALSSDEVVAALETADMNTIKRVRAYERKFANRPDVAKQVLAVHHRTLERDGPSKAPGVLASEAAREASAKTKAATTE